MDDCLFCKIAAGGVAAKKVYLKENVDWFLYIWPKGPTQINFLQKKNIGAAK